jgi:hypothetical protein
MNNLLIAALTFVMLPAVATQASAKNAKNCKEASSALVVEKMNFSDDLVNEKSEDEMTSVNVDYIIGEDGKAYVTYVDAASEKLKIEVVKFIESASYNFNIVPGKIYSMQLTLKK